jgi:hypothetical protein
MVERDQEMVEKTVTAKESGNGEISGEPGKDLDRLERFDVEFYLMEITRVLYAFLDTTNLSILTCGDIADSD